MADQDELDPRPPKPVFWIASSKRDLRGFPRQVRRTFGQALFDAQKGQKHPNAKPLRGFGSAKVLEIIENDSGATYRAVYTVRFARAVYVLHAFQKKSKAGIKTPMEELNRIKSRLREAVKDYAEWIERQKRTGQDDS